MPPLLLVEYIRTGIKMDTSSGESPFSITFEVRPDYLYAYVKGEKDSYEISKAYWQAISDECARNSVQKVLVDEDLAEPLPSMTDVFQGAAERSLMGLAGLKIAFVDRQIDHLEQNRFGELVATNRGLFCKVFSDFREAEAWLVAEQPTQS
jgi:hypothetical protein